MLRGLAILATVIGSLAATATCMIPSMGMYPGRVTPPLMSVTWVALGIATIAMIVFARRPGRERLTLGCSESWLHSSPGSFSPLSS